MLNQDLSRVTGLRIATEVYYEWNGIEASILSKWQSSQSRWHLDPNQNK